MPSSPGALKARLTEALERVQMLEREMKNAKAREKRAKTSVRSLLAQLSAENLINEEPQRQTVDPILNRRERFA